MSNVVFHKKYKPLFKLLSNYELPKEKQDKELLGVHTVLLSGGRDSGKTFCLGSFTAIATAQYNHRVLFTRYTMTSTTNSITASLNNRMELFGLTDEFNFANNDYKCKEGIGKISITGQKTSAGADTAKLKSLEDYSIFITDEGEELRKLDEWKKIKRSIRAKDVQSLSIISFNPPTKQHFLYEEFYKHVPEGFNGIKEGVMYIHTTYLDNGRDNMALHNWNEYEALRLNYELYLSTPVKERDNLSSKIKRDYVEYKTAILGGFRDVAEGVIFEYSIGDYVAPEYAQMYGMDQGWEHPTTLIKVNVDKSAKKIYLKEEYYRTHQKPWEIYRDIKDVAGNDRIWCDSAVPMFISDLKERGLYIKKCNKPELKDSIKTILGYELIVEKNSVNLQTELDNYRWSDKKKDYPMDDWNHAIDAMRYAFTHIVNTKKSQVT